MNSWIARAVVLKRVNLGEADRILTIYSAEKGKLKILGKGLRKLSSRRGGNLEIFNIVKVRLVSGRLLDIITEVETIEAFGDIRRNLLRVGLAYQMVEVVDKLSAEGVENREVFDLLVGGLKRTEGTNLDAKDVLADFAVGVLRALGFWPRDRAFSGDWQKYIESVVENPLRSPRILTRLGEGLK